MKLRVVFDEQMSVRVARALAALGKPVTFIGQKGQLPKGSLDPEVASFAKVEKRAVFTVNYDMVLAACDQQTRFIWFDKRGREPLMIELASICLSQWPQWEAAMADPGVHCLKVGRKSLEALSLPEARRRATRRYSQMLRANKAGVVRKANRNQGTLIFPDDED